MATDQEPSSLTDIVGALKALGGERDEVSGEDIRERFGERSFGPFLLIPALIEISPIGGIPGLPTVLALLISSFAIQILLGRRHLWLPNFIGRRKVSGDKLAGAMEKLGGVARWSDRIVHHRLAWATRRPYLFAIAVITIALCATVPFLELVPFASTAPMGAIALFGLGLLAKDGLVVILASIMSAAAFYVVYASLL